MGGRGSSSATASAAAVSAVEIGGASPNAEKHRKYLAGELGTKVTKNDEFMMRMVFPGMNYNKVRHSKSSTYAHADRVSKDGEHISVMVPGDRVRATPYGFALTLDSGHVQYLKSWQVTNQTKPYGGVVGLNVSMSRKYFNPKPSRVRNDGYPSDAKQRTWDEWLKAAKAQQRKGNIVSIRQ